MRLGSRRGVGVVAASLIIAALAVSSHVAAATSVAKPVTVISMLAGTPLTLGTAEIVTIQPSPSTTTQVLSGGPGLLAMGLASPNNSHFGLVSGTTLITTNDFTRTQGTDFTGAVTQLTGTATGITLSVLTQDPPRLTAMTGGSSLPIYTFGAPTWSVSIPLLEQGKPIVMDVTSVGMSRTAAGTATEVWFRTTAAQPLDTATLQSWSGLHPELAATVMMTNPRFYYDTQRGITGPAPSVTGSIQLATAVMQPTFRLGTPVTIGGKTVTPIIGELKATRTATVTWSSP